MKAISIKEPWASLILSGEKTIETRKWATKYRGPLLICVSKLPKSELSGMAIGVAYLNSIEPIVKDHEVKACCPVYPRALSWHLVNPILIEPFPVSGKLGVFEVNFNGEEKFSPNKT